MTCVDKANVFQAFAFFRDIFYERAARFPDLAADHAYVDAFAMTMAQAPWTIDVAVTENMFGDILSDLGAALMGGMGYAPSADIGDEHGVFQPCHGSAPDIAGKGLANPAAMILSGDRGATAIFRGPIETISSVAIRPCQARADLAVVHIFARQELRPDIQVLRRLGEISAETGACSGVEGLYPFGGVLMGPSAASSRKYSSHRFR